MNYYIFIRPIIGAGIGYITNWIAVKMLFRPLNPIKIGKLTLPFTPGIIPKNKERIAISIGNSISENLLTEEALKETLLSDEKKAEVRQNIINSLNEYVQDSNITLENLLSNYVSNESLNNLKQSITNHLTNEIFNNVKTLNLGNIVSEQFTQLASEKLKGSILGIFGGNNIVNSLGNEVNNKVNSYIDDNGKVLIHGIIDEEIEKIENTTTSTVLTQIGESNLDLISIIMDLYEKIILEKLPSLLQTVNISKIVSDKINNMPTLELEKLILDIMKKELNALVNLGALIGLILGFLNLLF